MLLTIHILHVLSALVFHPVAPLDHQRLCSDVAPSWPVDTTRVALHQVFPHNNRTQPLPLQAHSQHHHKDLSQYREERFDLCRVLLNVLSSSTFHQTRNSKWRSGPTPLSFVPRKR
jgi:hypothetical protein